MSTYLTTDEVTLRISLIENRLGELSSQKEKIAFKSFNSQSYDIKRDYINKYGAAAEKQFNINQLLAIGDIDVKVRHHQSELTELRTVLSERKKIEAANIDAVRRLLRAKEIERINATESRCEDTHTIRFVPAFHGGGFVPVGHHGGFVPIGLHGGFVPMFRPDGVGVFAPFSPSPTSGFVTAAHVIGRKSSRTI